MRKRVLLVDDEEGILSLISATLGYDNRYDLTVARNGQEALSVAKRERPDLVILDLLMPALDGCAVCRAIKESPATAHAKVIVLTALAQSTDRQRAAAAGADDFITKPFSPTKLLAKVSEMLGAS